MHGKPIFKKDIRIFSEGKRFIKSIQYRIEEHKSKFIEKQLTIQKTNPNVEIKNSKNSFFTKVIGNNNIGIEFSKNKL